MKKLLAALTVAAAMVVCVPAQAGVSVHVGGWGGWGGWNGWGWGHRPYYNPYYTPYPYYHPYYHHYGYTYGHRRNWRHRDWR